MCLTVKKVPATQSAGIIVQCLKHLQRFTKFGKLYTPHRKIPVPSNGWLLPTRHLESNEEIYLDQEINGNVIHAYEDVINEEESIMLTDLYSAFAFCVVAYGEYQDLVAKALYIPNCDSEDKTQTLKEINRIMELRKKTIDNLKVFPQLEKLYAKN